MSLGENALLSHGWRWGAPGFMPNANDVPSNTLLRSPCPRQRQVSSIGALPFVVLQRQRYPRDLCKICHKTDRHVHVSPRGCLYSQDYRPTEKEGVYFQLRRGSWRGPTPKTYLVTADCLQAYPQADRQHRSHAAPTPKGKGQVHAVPIGFVVRKVEAITNNRVRPRVGG